MKRSAWGADQEKAAKLIRGRLRRWMSPWITTGVLGVLAHNTREESWGEIGGHLFFAASLQADSRHFLILVPPIPRVSVGAFTRGHLFAGAQTFGRKNSGDGFVSATIPSGGGAGPNDGLSHVSLLCPPLPAQTGQRSVERNADLAAPGRDVSTWRVHGADGDDETSWGMCVFVELIALGRPRRQVC